MIDVSMLSESGTINPEIDTARDSRTVDLRLIPAEVEQLSGFSNAAVWPILPLHSYGSFSNATITAFEPPDRDIAHLGVHTWFHRFETSTFSNPLSDVARLRLRDLLVQAIESAVLSSSDEPQPDLASYSPQSVDPAWFEKVESSRSYESTHDLSDWYSSLDD